MIDKKPQGAVDAYIGDYLYLHKFGETNRNIILWIDQKFAIHQEYITNDLGSTSLSWYAGSNPIEVTILDRHTGNVQYKENMEFDPITGYRSMKGQW